MVAGAGAAVTLALGALGWRLAGPAGAVLAVGLWGPVLAGLLLELARLRAEEAELHARQGRAFTSLLTVLEPRLPLPSTRGWAASPDLLGYLARWILTERPETVVELGSGTSTLCLGYALERAGRGAVTAVDHDEAFGERTRAAVRSHGLDDRVRVLHAPLVEVDGPGSPWYDLGGLDLPGRIDLLFIDGPPRRSGHRTRYPALPKLRDRLTPETLIVLDDGLRRSEREIVELWREEFRFGRVELLEELEKGAWVLTGLGTA